MAFKPVQAFFDSWMLRWQEDRCRDPQWIKFVFACPSQSLAYAKGAGGYPTAPTYPKPEFAFFMIKYVIDVDSHQYFHNVTCFACA